MAETEGVIKYHLNFTPGPAPDLPSQLNAWREILYRLRLLGQDPARYGGLGFGNVSRRVVADSPSFVISGTQTGLIERLQPEHYCLVTACDPARNHVIATGPVRPSSEALTHAAMYAGNWRIGAVLHVHSPEIWHRARQLGLPCTDSAIEYGTPAMAAEVGRLLDGSAASTPGVIAMQGHEDGVVAFGADESAAGTVLVETLALALDQS